MALLSTVASLRIPSQTQLNSFVGHVRVPNSVRRKSSNTTTACPISCRQRDILSSVIGGVAETLLPSAKHTDELKRKDFPPDFMFGASTSALQTEGPGTEGGRGPSSWDGMINDPSTPQAENGADSYIQYKEDVKSLKDAGLNAYRMSISWSRILPKGKLSGGINQEGIDFYNKFFEELLDNGITPIVTLFHFDIPQALLNEYRGFLSPNIVNDFKDYADICFKNFGDKVKHWTTINEPQNYASGGFVVNLKPPANQTSDRFLVAHRIILCHAAAAKHYKQNYQAQQGGEIGLSIVGQWYLPYSNYVPHDREAAERASDFMMAWMMDPLVFGDYPFSMRALVRNALPEFTDEEKEMVKGAYDFIGLNYYTSRYVKNVPIDPDYVYDTSLSYRHVEEQVQDKDGKLIGPLPPRITSDFYIYPEGLKHVLLYLKDRYSNPKIIVTENGVPEGRDDSIPFDEALKDDHRINVMTENLYSVRDAIKAGVDVHGFFVWSLMDCMEVGSFYSKRFGLYFTEFNNNYKRTPKKSAKWFHDFMKGKH